MQMMTQFHMIIKIPIDGYSLPSQLIKILHVMIIFFVWIERCQAHIDKCHSIKTLVKNFLTTTIKMGIAIWTMIRKHKVVHDPNKQKNMEVAFWKEWSKNMVFVDLVDNVIQRHHIFHSSFLKLGII
jgi:hypothetical protein